MSALIEEFKREHLGIVTILNEVKELGILSKEGQAKLMSIKASLLEHLWNEDEQLYPVLRKASEHNKKLKEILSFINGLGNIHEQMLNFMVKYSKKVIDSYFQREYERLFESLSKRIEYEEEILFYEYNNLT